MPTHEELLAARRAAYAAMSVEERRARRARENAAAKERRKSESPEQREARLAAGRARAAAWRAKETPEQRDQRLAYLRAYHPQYRKNYPERVRQNAVRYYTENKEKILQQGKEYRAKHGKKVAAKRITKIMADPALILPYRLRHRIYLAVRKASASKANRSMALTGCSVNFLVGWLRLQFQPEMTMENYGKWHIDHIIPCSAFDLTIADQQKVAFHFTNLRPAWAEENISKGAKSPVDKIGDFWTLQCIQRARVAIGLFSIPVAPVFEEKSA